ncbi:ABC transporter ATP-binding protein [Paracoccus seriniphilus]|uniref:Amino acid/amide ABC transporter ATP-binding protein 1, HAAT family n=1 Tax=Paracoccus seriniphilus TaxID=184748 RepID=A0A239PPD9_9RHOB|nr:ABC transporter ATP-binding protein [Paracoccus seriniphilus]WCR14795.1 ABC transporter ATP-binding protein [Paracoccus seriniphilus]SNT71792.1 amino acid/amide ABC transporter ATP-binding protein 1, HAAT family [Paracoccus seriniphilus]
MSLLDVRKLRKAYGALKVTDDLDLQVEEGEIHAIIGPNGAGKSTLIAQLSGEAHSDGGSVRFAGTEMMGMPMHRRVRAGMSRSFQITSILPGFTALENVATAAQARMGSSFRFFSPVAEEQPLNDAALAALRRVGLADRAFFRAGSLSHGEKRQLELAIALATQPRLLLLDEPLAGTSGQEADRLVDVMKSLRQELTLVLIEHDMNAVFSLADRVSVLVYGRIIATGTPDQIRADPRVREAYLGEESEEGTDAAS